jgi:hypothetical protein
VPIRMRNAVANLVRGSDCSQMTSDQEESSNDFRLNFGRQSVYSSRSPNSATVLR